MTSHLVPRPCGHREWPEMLNRPCPECRIAKMLEGMTATIRAAADPELTRLHAEAVRFARPVRAEEET